MSEYLTPEELEKIEPSLLKEIRKAAVKSCDGNQHTHRYQHMLNQFIKGALWRTEHAQNEIGALREEVDNLKEFYNNWYGVAEEYLQQKKYIQQLEAEKQTEDKTAGECNIDTISEADNFVNKNWKRQIDEKLSNKEINIEAFKAGFYFAAQFKQVEQSNAVEFAEWLRKNCTIGIDGFNLQGAYYGNVKELYGIYHQFKQK